MEIRVLRNESHPMCVQSRILIDGAPKFYGLEPPFSEFSGGPICIPEGSYDVWLRWSPKFSMWVPAVIGVRGRMDIEIHPGNQPDDTAGCLLIGYQSAPGYISESRSAFGTLIEGIKQALPSERVTIRYVNQFTEGTLAQAKASKLNTLAALLLAVLLFFTGATCRAQQDTHTTKAGQPVQAVAASNSASAEYDQAEAAKGVGVPASVRRNSEQDTMRHADAPAVSAMVTRADNPINRAFYIAEGLRFGAAFADFDTTSRFTEVGRCVESAPGMGRAPSRARVYEVGLPIEAGVSVASYFLQRALRHNPRADRIAALVMVEGSVAAVHAYAAARNGRCL